MSAIDFEITETSDMVTFLPLSSQRIENQHELHFAPFIPEALKKRKKNSLGD
jgi:hypothetical protein